jgi:molecular chaperone HtpG
MALITPEGQMSMNLERLMKAHGQQTKFNSQRILEVNGKHPVIQKLAELITAGKSDDIVTDGIFVLFDETLITEGEPIKNPVAFTERLSRFIMAGLKK